ncbi:MAG: YCF48-related protein, partial [Chlorobiales bacterium]|nr:YCF48-related protein [Chlorobiales bacterium]
MHTRTATIVVVALLLGGPCCAQEIAGQEEPMPEPAVMAPRATTSLLLDGAAAGDQLVVVGERGHILRSSDHGTSWQQMPAPVSATLTGVHFHDQRRGWAVGHDAVIVRTDNGGETWQLVYRDVAVESPLFDVWFKDADNGFAVGAYGLFLETGDGGTTWSSRFISDDDLHLHHLAVSPADPQRLFIAAEAGAVYRSDDGGTTWTSLPSPYEGSFFACLPLAGDTVLLFGLRGHLFRSGDAGETWQELPTGTVAMLTDS